jgi:predicted enzyme related to lactoylglutathione lyase
MRDSLDSSRAFSSFSTNDLEEAKSFYGEVLGMDIEEEGKMGLRINLSSGGIVFIYPKEDHEPATFTVLNFPVDDIDKSVDILIEKGISLERYEGFEQDEKGVFRNSDPGRGPAAIAWFKDPSGNVISILQENGEGNS